MNRHYGYSGKILWVDLSTQSSHIEERNDIFWRCFVGGGLLGAKLLFETNCKDLDPFDPQVPLIFASSVVAGHMAPGLARFAVVAKSPLTGGIGEARTEGPFGTSLKQCGADVIALVGKSKRPVTVIVRNGEARFQDSSDLWGRNTGDVVDELERTFGAQIHSAVIGPAGENKVRFASIVSDRTFQVQRMGFGAIMGAKNVKAILVDPIDAPPVYDEKYLNEITDWYRTEMEKNDLTKWQYDQPGFSDWIYLHGLDAALCVNNYSKCAFKQVDSFKTERFLEHRIEDLICPGCPNNCIKSVLPNGLPELDNRSSGIHQEVTGTMGPNIGIGDLDVTLTANNLCNQYGLDPTSLGFTISFAMELFDKGILKKGMNADRELNFGDAAAALKMIDDITFRRGLGDVLAEGTKRAAEVIGSGAEQYAMQVKGMEMVPFEPRSQSNLALGYAIAPVGPRYEICEHDWDFDTTVGWAHTLDLSRTIGILDRIPMDYIGIDKVRNFKALFNLWSAADAYLFCIFAVAPTRLLSLEKMAGILHAVTGWETSSYEIMRTGERRTHIMRWFNHVTGFTSQDDLLPQRFFVEPLQEGRRKGDMLDLSKFQLSIHNFYLMMGWDERGIPTLQTIYDYQLESIIDDKNEFSV